MVAINTEYITFFLIFWTILRTLNDNEQYIYSDLPFELFKQEMYDYQKYSNNCENCQTKKEISQIINENIIVWAWFNFKQPLYPFEHFY